MTKQRRSLKTAAYCSAATLALALAVPHAIADPVRIDIAADQPLKDAINDFARQADQQVLVATDIVSGFTAPALSGVYEPKDALTLLIADTGLTVTESGNETFLIAQIDETSTRPTSTATPAAGPTGSGDPVSVEGTVRGAITNSNLKGARVEIVETGQTTATDDLGRFRFPAVSPGTYTLRISYLGRETIQETIDLTSGGDFSQTFAMGFPAALSVTDRVEVLGLRTAREQALNQERSAANTATIITADQLGTFNGTTISEALRRAPGVAFIPDDQTGNGANIIVRGIEPDLNQIQINGLRLLDGSGLGRSPDLSGVLLEGIESVTINKSLLPSQDSNGAGALVEIETKSPLDRDRRFATFNLEYGERGDDFGDDFLIGGTISGIFGADDSFGASISASFRETNTTRINYDVLAGGATTIAGRYLPLDENGDPVSNPGSIDPRTLFPFEDGSNELYPTTVAASQGNSNSNTLSLTGTLEKQVADHTNLRFDATYSNTETESFNASTSAGVFVFPSYQLAPISPGGEERFHVVSEDGDTGNINGSLVRQASFSPGSEISSIALSFRGETSLDEWSFTYNLGYTQSENKSGQLNQVFLQGVNLDGPVGFGFGPIANESFLTQAALDNTTGDGRLVSLFAPLQPGDDGFILPLFNQAGFDFYNDIDLQPGSFFQSFGSRESESSATTIGASVRRDFTASYLRNLEVGFTYQDTEFFSPSDGPSNDAFYRLTSGSLLSDAGLRFGPGLLTQVGAENDLNALTESGVNSVFTNIDMLLDQGVLAGSSGFPVSRNQERTTGEETISSYVQAQLDIGKLEVVGGFRLEHLDLSSTYFQTPDATITAPPFTVDLSDFETLINASASQTDLLPRIAATFRHSDNLQFRAAYFKTASQPQLSLLTDQDVVSFNGFSNRFSVLRGNPDLKPATTDNFSADVEYYTDNAGVFSASVFYKTIENALQSNFTEGNQSVLPDDFDLPAAFSPGNGALADGSDLILPDDAIFFFSRPINADTDSTLWGIELNAEQRLSWLPSPFDGVGVIANYTYTDSERPFERNVPESIDPAGFITLDLPFADSPENQGTVGVTYSKFGIDGSLLYTYQDRRLSQWRSFGLSSYNEDFDSLDLQVAYVRELSGRDVRVFFRGNDLLRGSDDPFLQTSFGGEDGVPKFFTGGTYFGGRSFEAGLSVTF